MQVMNIDWILNFKNVQGIFGKSKESECGLYIT